MVKAIDNYWNRHDPAKSYVEILFRDGYGTQASEMNELQSIFTARVKAIADSLFKDGDILQDAQITVNAQSGALTAQSGLVYLSGAVWPVESASLVIPVQGTISVGIRLVATLVSELEDPALCNPALGSRGEGEPGAWRRRIVAVWGYDGDGKSGDFYPVHAVDDGVVRAKETPPNLDAFNQGIARYDRDSTGGGTYISNGLTVRAAEDSASGAQIYTVAEGRCRVCGYGVDLLTSRRLSYVAKPDIRFIDTEIVEADGSAKQRITVAHPPIKSIVSLRVTLQKTVSIVHGAYSGASDALPDVSIMSIVEVRQGDTIYETGTDYKRTGDKVDWSPGGAEPAPGSTYQVIYTYIDKTLTPEAVDFDGFSVGGAVAGTGIMVSYNQALPRIDRLCITSDGTFAWVQGVPAEYNPKAPSVPETSLAIASVSQTWRDASARTVKNDGVRVVAFSEIEALAARVEYALQEVARQRLEADVFTRESGARVGLFVDPLLDDSMRDQGLTQSAAVVDGVLTLPLSARVYALSADVAVPVARTSTPRVLMSQPYRTGTMKVNPYMAFDPLPAPVELLPAVDRWNEVQTAWTSAVTRAFNVTLDGYYHIARSQSTQTTTETLASSTKNIEHLRQIDVAFSVKGFGPGEILRSITFDGIAVQAKEGTLTADSKGNLSGTFTIPANVPAGAKTVEFKGGEGGSKGSAVFVGQGTLTAQTLRQVRTVTTYWVDPLAQTVVLDNDTQLAGVDLWFSAKGQGGVRVQIREVSNGVPTRTVLGEAIVPVEQIVISGGGHTRILFPAPVSLAASTEYAVVVLCDDAETELYVAELGQFDQFAQQWVASQPYTIGVLLSSSNASTWTAHQSRDLTFRLLEASFADGTNVVELGEAEITEQATDIILLALAETPTAQTRVEYELGLPSGASVTVADGQPVRLTESLTGALSVKAKLAGDAKGSPVLWPGSQVLAGTVQESADYYTRSITAAGAVKAVLIYDALIPSGAGVTPEIQVDSGAWESMEADGATQQGDGLVEYKFKCALNGADLIKVRLTLTGTLTARPMVQNVRLMAVA